MSLRWETNVKNGVCSLEFDRKENCFKVGGSTET